MSNLSPQQHEALTAFVEITQVADVDTSARFLELFNWDVDAAVDNYLTGGFRLLQTHDMHDGGHDHYAAAEQVHHNIGGGGGAGTGARRTPRRQQAAVPAFLRPLVEALSAPVGGVSAPEAESRSFIAKYENQYGQAHPQFFEGGFQQAVAHAHASHQFLFVYLQSPLHEDTDRFARSVLNDPEVCTFLDRNFVIWAGSVTSKEAYQLSMDLQVSTYPYCGVLMSRTETQQQLVARLEGMIDRGVFLERLQNMIAAHSAHLRRLQAEAQRQAETTQLVQEQDMEYIAAMEADRQRRLQEEQALAEKQRREAELRRQQEEEQMKQQQFEQQIAAKRAQFDGEPTSADAASIRIQLPNGAKLDRKFLPSDNIQLVRDYIEVHFFNKNINIRNFSISTNYPKRTLHNAQETIAEAGLAPRGVLYVQDLDA